MRLGPVDVFVDGHAWAINRPLLLGWRDGTRIGGSLSWGNGNSDPVWIVDVSIDIPLLDVLDTREADVRRLAARDGWTCHYCSIDLGPDTATRDHVIPKHKRGTDHLANLVLACDNCNGAKAAIDYDEFIAGPWLAARRALVAQGLAAARRPPRLRRGPRPAPLRVIRGHPISRPRWLRQPGSDPHTRRV